MLKLHSCQPYFLVMKTKCLPLGPIKTIFLAHKHSCPSPALARPFEAPEILLLIHNLLPIGSARHPVKLNASFLTVLSFSSRP